MEIHDGYLLEEIIKFCNNIESKPEFECNKVQEEGESREDNLVFQHPLDKEIRTMLENLYGSIEHVGDDYLELPYALCTDLDKLWNRLIEKSIICLRFFDKREPFSGNNGKVPFAYGLEDLEEYHKRYIEFEGELYGSDAYYRDHVFHVVRVWMLGICLLLTNNKIIGNPKAPLIENIHFEGEDMSKGEDKLHKKEEDISKGEDKLHKKFKKQLGKETWKSKKLEQLRKGAVVYNKDRHYKIINKNKEPVLVGINNFSDEINTLEKISMWTIMSLCHDLGYPLEKSKKVLGKTEKMMEFFVAQPNINGNIRFDGTRDSNNKDIILFASKKMKLDNAKCKRPLYKASIQEKYKFKYMLSLESFAHGVISSIIIYKMLIYFKETDNNSDPNYVFGEEDARQFYIRRDILRAIASHTCNDIYHIDVTTFPMLLFVCDELQEWGRKSWKNMYQGTANNAVKLSIQSYRPTEISYTESINMKKAGKEEIVENIKKILVKQYLLYQTTFRDGQDTSKREFNFIKHVDMKIGKEYKSIEKIVIDFSINHEKENEFFLKIIDSGECEDDNKGTEALVAAIREIMKPYEDKKYGTVKFL